MIKRKNILLYFIIFISSTIKAFNKYLRVKIKFERTRNIIKYKNVFEKICPPSFRTQEGSRGFYFLKRGAT